MLMVEVFALRNRLLDYDALSVPIGLRSPMTGRKSIIARLLTDLASREFGVLILEVLVWILSVHLFRHLVRRMLKLLKIGLLGRLPTLNPDRLVLLEHLVVAFHMLLVLHHVSLRRSRTVVAGCDKALSIHTLWHLYLYKKLSDKFQKYWLFKRKSVWKEIA